MARLAVRAQISSTRFRVGATHAGSCTLTSFCSPSACSIRLAAGPQGGRSPGRSRIAGRAFLQHPAASPAATASLNSACSRSCVSVCPQHVSFQTSSQLPTACQWEGADDCFCKLRKIICINRLPTSPPVWSVPVSIFFKVGLGALGMRFMWGQALLPACVGRQPCLLMW